MAVQTKTRKVYDYKIPPVKNQLVQVLKKRKNASSIADLISDSGLPKYQVEETMKIISNEYRGHLKVTESGELLYYFPAGMRNTIKGFIPGLKRFWSAFSQGLMKVLTLLFKIWIVVMLVGYFVLFVVILLAAIAAAIAAATAGKGRSSRKGGGFYLVFRVIQLFVRVWFYKSLLDDRSYHQQKQKQGRPLHQSVFAFVFGDPDPNRNWEEREKRRVIAYLQAHKGVLTVEELMAITGREFDDAQQLLNRYLLEFEGSPEVSERGTLLYHFPELLRTTGQSATQVSLQAPEKKQLMPFSNNEAKTNGWLAFFNIFNVAFGSYFAGHVLLAPVYSLPAKVPIDFAFVYKFIFGSLAGTVADPNGLILMGLGVVPVLFSIFFFLIPALRNARRLKTNNLIKEENLRKKIFAYFFRKPLQASPADVIPSAEDEKPPRFIKFKQKLFDRFAAEKRGEIEAASNGALLYNFKEFDEELRDLNAYRGEINLKDYALGKTVFDSGEE